MMILFQCVRIESILINTKILSVLLLLLIFGHSYAGTFCMDGMNSYLCVAIAFNTSIAVGKIRRRLLGLFRKNINDASFRCTAHVDAKELPQKSALSFNENAERLNDRIDETLKYPSLLYPIFGIIFAVASTVLLFTGIPCWIRGWIVVAPFPAIGFYATALLVYFDMFVQLNGSLYDRRKEANLNKMKNHLCSGYPDPNVEALADLAKGP